MKKSTNKPSGIKKGKASWKPASNNEFINKESGFRYRMMRKDPENLAKKEAEGWEIISKVNDTNAAYVDPDKIDDGKPLTSVIEGRDWIYGRITEEQAAARDEYHDVKNERQIAGLTAHLKKDIQKSGAQTHGNITISSRKGEQVIN